MVVQSGHTRHRTERLLTAKKDDFNRKNAANKRALGDLSGRLQGLDMKKVNEKVGPASSPRSCELRDRRSSIGQVFQTAAAKLSALMRITHQ